MNEFKKIFKPKKDKIFAIKVYLPFLAQVRLHDFMAFGLLQSAIVHHFGSFAHVCSHDFIALGLVQSTIVHHSGSPSSSEIDICKKKLCMQY